MARRFVAVSLVLVVVCASGIRLRAQEPAPVPPLPPVTTADASDADVLTAPVELDGAVLFRVRGVSSFPAAQRAVNIEDRLKAIAADRTIPVDSLHATDADGVSRVLAGDRLILTLVEADATLEQVRRQELATAHADRLRQAILDYRAARAPGALRQAAVNFLGSTVALLAALVILRWLWRRIDRVLTERLQSRIHTVEIKSFELMRAEQIWTVVRAGLLALRTAVFLAILLVYLGFVLAQLPWTRGLSSNLVAFTLGPLGVLMSGLVSNLPRLVFLIVLFFVVRVALRLIHVFFDAVDQGSVTLDSFEREWAQPTYQLVRLTIVVLALVVAYPYIPGSNSEAFKGISLFIGVVFSLGSSSAISNTIAGYTLTYRRALKLGDRVKIGAIMGDVIEIRLPVTHLRSFKNEEIIIPNSQILAAEVINYSSLSRTSGGLIFHSDVSIGYGTPWRQVETLLLAAVERTEGFAKEPPPFVWEKELGTFSVTYEVNAYSTDVKSMVRLYGSLHRNILDVFNEQGIQIMVPAYEGDPAEPKLVKPGDSLAGPREHRPPSN